MQFSDLKTRCAARFRDTSNNVVSAVDWGDYLNDAYMDEQTATSLWPWMELTNASFTATAGTRNTTLSRDQFAEIHRAILAGDFFNLWDRYEVAATDLPSILTTVPMNGATKSVYHYGTGCGTDLDLAPPGLCDLEALLEQIPAANGWAGDAGLHGNLMRGTGQVTGGPPPLSQGDRQAFANALDTLLTQLRA